MAGAKTRAVDERRVTYLKTLWHAQRKSKPLSRRLTELEYAAYLGLVARHGPETRKLKATYAPLIGALSDVLE